STSPLPIPPTHPVYSGAGSLPSNPPGHEQELARVLRSVGGLVVVGIQMFDLESGAHEQVLGLESEEVPQRKRLHEALLPSVGVRHVVDQLEATDLREAIVRDRLVTPDHSAAIRSRELRLFTVFLAQGPGGEGLERRIEQVQDEMAAVDQMTVNGCETGQLVFHGQQVLEGTKRERGQGEPAAELEVAHVGLDELHPLLHGLGFVLQVLATDGEHVGGQVEADDLDARAGRRNEDAPGSASELQDRTSRLTRRLHEKRDVQPASIRRDVVVQLGDQRVLLVVTGRGHRRGYGVNDSSLSPCSGSAISHHYGCARTTASSLTMPKRGVPYRSRGADVRRKPACS